ncbi:ABC transporter permease [Fulvivirgaceae bacterium BMA10]|uniref:ABC transporter permease n=1 Tax=Splendidivirga corallicola TaxID=3051826 RepID=A0ABT8KVL4_9BACT|nr:ABC transporter permease [Fulvivirgaceae bacterium BMA10]
MLKNYLKTSIRNLVRNRAYLTINIIGLSIGISCAMIIYLLATYMTGYDQFHTKRERIYRFTSESMTNGAADYNPGVPPPFIEAVKNDFTQLELVAPVVRKSAALIAVNSESGAEPKYFEEGDGIVYTNDNLYQIIDRNWISGNPLNALSEPNSVVLSERIASKYFPNGDALGKIIQLDKKTNLKITGVLEDFPELQTDFPLDILISYKTKEPDFLKKDWGHLSSDFHCYVLLKEGVSAKVIEDQVPAFVKKYHDETPSERTYHFQPLSDLHYNQNFGTLSSRTVSKTSIWVLGILGLFLICTACINFINLSTAQASKRAKEVGVRKVLGSSKGQLIFQFMAETLIITFGSIALSLGLAELFLIKVNEVLQLKLNLDLLDLNNWLYLIGLLIVVSVLAGIYPSFIMSRFKPVSAMKSSTGDYKGGNFWLRRALVIFQFVLTQFLIISTVIVFYQMDFLKNAPMGFDKEALVNVNLPNSDGDKEKVFDNYLNEIPGIKTKTFASDAPASQSFSSSNFYFKNGEETIEGDVQLKAVDHNYIKTYGLTILAGEDLPVSDTLHSALVNESFMKYTGYSDPEKIVGQTMRFGGGNWFSIRGVVKDFYTESFDEKLGPLALYNDSEWHWIAGIKLETNNITTTVKQIEAAYKKVYPEYQFDYYFMDEAIENFYRSEQKMTQILTGFSLITILIGCLGLYGLVSFMANQKTKEIGIRKVLGAASSNIAYIFGWEFLKLILIAFVIAAPLSYLGIQSWLKNFVYKIDLGIGFFILGILITIVIALMTVGYKSLKAALANPVDSLRDE